ncbi:MAG: hypothetical protein QW318_07750 [Candidatus Caldarchaeum sp.]
MNEVTEHVYRCFAEDLSFYLSKMGELREYFIDYVRQQNHLLLFSDVEERLHPFFKYEVLNICIEVRRKMRPYDAYLPSFLKCATSGHYATETLRTGDMPSRLADKVEEAFFPAQEAYAKLVALDRSYHVNANLRCYMNNVPNFARRFSIEYKPYSNRMRLAPNEVVKTLNEVLQHHNFYQTFRDLSE